MSEFLHVENLIARINEVNTCKLTSQRSSYQWKSKYSGTGATQLKRLKELERGVSHYKKIVAEPTYGQRL